MTHRPRPTFSPGFRLSPLDVAVLAAGAVGTVAMAGADRWLGVAVAFVVGHFFLFCNVLRMSRSPELVWAGCFSAGAVVTVVFRAASWPAVLAASAGLTVVLTAVEVRRQSYHGVGWRRVNPRLPAWWAEHGDRRPESADEAGGRG